MIPLIAAGMGLASAIPSIFAGISAKKSYNKYANLLGGLKLDMPEEINVVGEMLRQRMSKDMPGFESAKTDVMNTIPATMREVVKAADSPSTVLSMLNSIRNDAATNINQLNVQNALQKVQSETNYSNFLSGVKAPMKMQIQEYGNQAKANAEQARMTGKAQMWQGITQGLQQGIQGGFGAYTGLMGMQNQKELLGRLSSYWGNTGSSNSPGGLNILDIINSVKSTQGFSIPPGVYKAPETGSIRFTPQGMIREE